MPQLRKPLRHSLSEKFQIFMRKKNLVMNYIGLNWANAVLTLLY